jgi:hypothetical protein
MNHVKLRDPRGWNLGFIKAFELPDGPFKLYVWLRMNARIDTGTLEISQSDIARALKKARGTIRNNLEVLQEAGVCRMKFSRNPEGRGWIRITDDYWPYERGGPEGERDDPELRSYLDRIREIVEERACIRKPLPTSDELLTRAWYKQGVTLEHVGQAILTGCGRKYVSWRNGAPRTPIGSLAYFETILGEVQEQKTSPEYWEYTRHRIERMEKLWVAGKDPDRFTRAWCEEEKTNISQKAGNEWQERE